MTGIGNEKTLTWQRYRLRGKPEISIRPLDRHVRRPAGLQCPALPVPGHEIEKQCPDGMDMALSGVLRNHIALWVDQDEGRPSLRSVGAPRGELRVVEHGVLDAVPLDRGKQSLRVRLVIELGRMN